MMTPAKPVAPSSRPYLAMGLTFLLLGVGFANPIPLVTQFPHGMWEGRISAEALNLYALTVFFGWGHFFYAWQGQWRATAPLPAGRRVSYWLLIVVVLGMLLALRSAAGVSLFSLVTWVYNIGHFFKAERVFARRPRPDPTTVEKTVDPAATPEPRPADPSINFYMPTLAFAWLTITLFHVGPFGEPLLVFLGSVLIAAVALLAGDWRRLLIGQVAWPLLTLFVLSETMVWGAYRPTAAFAVGVYVMHVAAASFFHYLGGYFYAQRGPRTPALLRPPVILLVNLLCLVVGYSVARHESLWPLQYVFGPEWFTLWVALHLLASDLLPVWKRSHLPQPQIALASPAATA